MIFYNIKIYILHIILNLVVRQTCPNLKLVLYSFDKVMNTYWINKQNKKHILKSQSKTDTQLSYTWIFFSPEMNALLPSKFGMHQQLSWLRIRPLLTPLCLMHVHLQAHRQTLNISSEIQPNPPPIQCLGPHMDLCLSYVGYLASTKSKFCCL